MQYVSQLPKHRRQEQKTDVRKMEFVRKYEQTDTDGQFLRLFLQMWTSSAGCCCTMQGQMLDNMWKALMVCRLSFHLASFMGPGAGGYKRDP